MPKVLPEYLEQRRKQILEAAAECFHESGFHQTSMQDICERADLSPGAVYRYFKAKDDIIAAICDEAHQQDLMLIEGIKASGNAFSVMEELGRAFFNNLSDEDIRGHIDMIAEAPHSAHVRATARRGAEAIVASFTDFVAAAQARGDVNPNLDAEAVAQLMCAIYHGFIVQKQINPDVDANRYFDAVMTVFRDGFFASRQAVGTPRALSR